MIDDHKMDRIVEQADGLVRSWYSGDGDAERWLADLRKEMCGGALVEAAEVLRAERDRALRHVQQLRKAMQTAADYLNHDEPDAAEAVLRHDT